MTAGDQTTLYVFDTVTHTLSQTWSIPNTAYGIAVTGGKVNLDNYSGGAGVSYSTSGTSLGNLPNSGRPGSGSAFDGTTDGTHNYAMAFGDGGVYQFNLDWTNPTRLFSIAAKYALGSTYDASNNSLWIGGRSANITDYSLTGQVLSSFTNPIAGSDSSNCCGSGLAIDSQGNLWENSNGRLYEFTRTGQSVGQFAIGTGANILGLEFSETGPSATPEPASIALGFSGLLALVIGKRAKASRQR